jgi:hypothetical protein
MGMHKVAPCYCKEIDDRGLASVSIYNEDFTKEIDGIAWVYPDKYSEEEQTRVQELLDEKWEEFDRENSDMLYVVNLTCDDLWEVETEEEGQAIIDEQCKRDGGALYTPDDFAIMTGEEYQEFLNNNELLDFVCND